MQKLARVAAALFVIVGGVIHLQLWRSGYRGIDYIGPLFIANVAVSAVSMLAILLGGDVRVAAATMLFSIGSLVALILSRTTGLLGFTERGWTDMAVQATTAELGAIVALALLLALLRRPEPILAPAPVRPAGWHRGH